ncbi:MAG TPA: right-handed parallel beta-helix repeat-containing protein [Myxococcaceae bacterium]|nr:right-handed parallel beta-helix repeat-containing protein [Myxococcaceae bacterium]
MQKLGWILGLALGVAGGPALAAGADGSWTQCPLPARLTADPAGRTFYVAPWGTNPGSCPTSAGYTFQTIDAAVRCAKGKDTFYVRAGTYGPFSISNFWPSDRVLVTNYPGENPTIDGWNSVGDYQAIVWLWNVSNLAFQGLTIQNTGVTDAEHGGYGVKIDYATYVKLYFNTIRNTARHGIVMDGHQHEVVGNEISQTVLRNQWKSSTWWDGGFASATYRQQWGLKFIANSVHDSWGECVDILQLSGATVQGNKIYNCYSVNLYVSNSQSVTVDRNYVFASTDSYNKPGVSTRALGIAIANEGSTGGWSAANVMVTSNIVERLSQAVRYWRSHSGGSIWDGYANLYVGFNTFAHLQTWPIRFDAPDGNPAGWNRLRQNIVLNDGGWAWYSNDNTNNWEVAKNWQYSSGTTATSPGLDYNPGGWAGAYTLLDSSALRWIVPPNSEWDEPAVDYNCVSRNPSDWGAAGAAL